jgi:hypothetical protein
MRYNTTLGSTSQSKPNNLERTDMSNEDPPKRYGQRAIVTTKGEVGLVIDGTRIRWECGRLSDVVKSDAEPINQDGKTIQQMLIRERDGTESIISFNTHN